MLWRYQLINSNFSVPAKIAHSANYYKACCGRKAYDIAAIKEFCKLRPDYFDLYLDGKLYLENFETVLVMGMSGKIGGGEWYSIHLASSMMDSWT